MVIEHEYPQRSDEWFAVRLGKLTGSCFSDLMKKGRGKSEWGETAIARIRQTAAEVLTGDQEESFTSKAMEWGTAYESAAMVHYMQMTGGDVRECGFFENSDIPFCGSSPDGVGDDFTLELKCPLSKTHLLYLLDAETLFNAYRWQVTGEALITEKPRAIIASYDPRYIDPEKRMVVFEHPTLEEDKVTLRERLLAAGELLNDMIS